MGNLLSINSYHYRRGGSDAVYFDHAKLFSDAGWQTSFYSMHHPKNQPSEWSKYFIDELEFGGDYSIGQKLAMAAKAIYSFEAQRKLRWLLSEHRVDVAHLHCIYHHHSPSILPVLKAQGIPVVLTAHDLKIACPAYKMLNHTGVCEACNKGSVLNVVKHRCVRDSLAASAIVALESGLQRTMRMYERHVDRIVVPSLFFLEKFVEWGWPRERFVHIPNFVDVGHLQPDYRPGNYFLYFGRLAPEKGVPTLIKSAVAADVPLIIAGTGPIEAQVRALAAEIDRNNRIQFVGFQSGTKLQDLVRGARAVVLPSEWYENAPMSVLESFGMGKPVIGARIGGIPELVTESTGWQFASGDDTELAALLAEVDAAPESRLTALGQSARQFVEARFNQSVYFDAMCALYREMGVH